MKKMLCAMLLAFVLFAPAAIQARSAVVYDSISPMTLCNWLQEEGYSASIDDDNDIVLKINGYKTFITFFKGNNSIQFYAIFKSDGITPSKIFNFHKNYRYARTYYNSEKKSAYLELDFDFEGGVTKQNVLNNIKHCKRLFEIWYDKVLVVK